ncbi:MAG TPA: heparinase II/III family protein, partial [Armatimonadota bacterium]|nr:heparinase II/III family protein [Armatimonadota bacterium]
MRITCVPVWLVAIAIGHGAIAQDLPANPGFEEVVDGGALPTRWQPRGVTRDAHELAQDARTGEWAAQIKFTEGEGNQVSGYYYSDPQPLPACKRVTVSAWVKVKSGGRGAYLRLLFQQGDAYIGLHNSVATNDTEGEWTRLEVSAKPPPEAEAWRMSIELSGLGTAVFDDCAADIEPADVIPAATRDAPADKPIELGEGRFGIIGAVADPAEGLRVTTMLKGRSALPPTVHLGAVWYRGQEQLGVVDTRAKAWQAETEASLPVRVMAGADAFRPIVYADSRELLEAAEIAVPELQAISQAEIAPLRITPAPHPRLFLTHDELTDLRSALADDPPPDLANVYAQLLAVADKCFEEQEIVVYGGRYSTSLPPAVPARHEDNFPYWTGLSREIEVRIEALAAAYLLTGEARYAELCKTWTLALCEWPQWTDPDYASPPACLDTGHFCHAVAFAYDLCYDALTEDERTTVRNALLEKGAEAVFQAGENGWAQTMGWPNGFAVVMGGMGIAGIATLGDDNRAEGYVRYARRRLYEFLEARDRDGGYVEGLTYGGYAMSLTMPFAATLSVHGDDLLAGHSYVEKTLRFAARCLDPSSATSVNFCDASYSTRGYNPVAGWRARHGDGLGRWYLQQNEGLSRLWRYTPPLAVLWHPLGVEAEPPGDWPSVAHYRDIGWVLMRSGFSADDFSFAMRSGHAGSHCQLDQNSFMLNVAGKWLLQDPGYGRTETDLHSTLMVDGKGQSRSGGRMEACGEVGDIVYAAGDAASCYDALERFTRHVIMVDTSYLVIVDEIASIEGAVSIESQFVTGV